MNLYVSKLKSAGDKIIAFLSLGLCLPLLITVGAIIKIGSPGPMLFKQRRVGKSEQIFVMYKFRSMYKEMSNSGDLVEGLSPEEARSQYKTTVAADPRVTPFGRFIRKRHIDELPQLINVLRGEMSLVGPRPYTPCEIADYSSSSWRKRHLVKPGLTGLAQVFPNSRNGKPSTRIALDLFYVKNYSLSLDIFIVLNTILKILQRGSH